MKKVTTLRILFPMILTILMLLTLPAKATSKPKKFNHHTVNHLSYLIHHNKKLHSDIIKTLEEQSKNSVWYQASINDLLAFFDHWLTWIPSPINISSKSKIVKNTVVNFPPGQFNQLINSTPYLRLNNTFMKWLSQFLNAAGNFYQTRKSAKYIAQWMALPAVHINQFVVPKDGYHSFKDFFLRKLKVQSRPISSPKNPHVVVSPADCAYDQPIKLGPNKAVHVKSDRLFLKSILDGSQYSQYFRGGVAVICHLNITDYHHFHSPVDGKIVASGMVGGIYYFDPKLYRHLYQHRRAYFVLKSKQGYVAMAAIGQWIVSSMSIKHRVGDFVHKGEELGHFNLGGSAIVLAFQPNDIEFVKKIQHSKTNTKTSRRGQFSGPWFKVGEKVGLIKHNLIK